jgi:hypothetical protein
MRADVDIELLSNLIPIGLVAGVIVYFILIVRYFSYLRAHHPVTYERIGKPSLILNNTPRNNILTLRFIMGSDSMSTGDHVLETKTKSLRFILYFYSSLFALLGVGVFYVAVFS